MKDHRQWYADVVDRTRAIVAATVPAGARVAVISKGDEALVQIPGREAWHFPRSPTGLYAGFYPRTGADAVAHLEELRAQGVGWLAIPASASWWLEHYGELREHLAGRRVAEHDGCAVFALNQLAAADGAPAVAPQVAAWLDALLPAGDVVAVGPEAGALHLAGRRVHHVNGEGAAGVDAAIAAGARFGVALGGGREVLAGRGRPLAAQRLAELFALRAPARPAGGYEAVRAGVRDAVGETVPAGARVLVISRGDEALHALGDRPAGPFPQDADGRWPGYHPEDSAQAVAALRRLTRDGAQFLVVPATEAWWLEHYAGLAEHLARRARRVHAGEHCTIFDLRRRPRGLRRLLATTTAGRARVAP